MPRASGSSRRAAPQRKARFPRLREIRTEMLEWRVTDIFARLPDYRPSLASIYRLEQGQAIRVADARRIFNVINAALDHKLDPSQELQMT
jgi:hypothetical protein